MGDMPEHAERDRKLTCSGIWGGVHNLDRAARGKEDRWFTGPGHSSCPGARVNFTTGDAKIAR